MTYKKPFFKERVNGCKAIKDLGNGKGLISIILVARSERRGAGGRHSPGR